MSLLATGFIITGVPVKLEIYERGTSEQYAEVVFQTPLKLSSTLELFKYIGESEKLSKELHPVQVENEYSEKMYPFDIDYDVVIKDFKSVSGVLLELSEKKYFSRECFPNSIKFVTMEKTLPPYLADIVLKLFPMSTSKEQDLRSDFAQFEKELISV